MALNRRSRDFASAGRIETARTTKLYDRTRRQIILDEIQRIAI